MMRKIFVLFLLCFSISSVHADDLTIAKNPKNVNARISLIDLQLKEMQLKINEAKMLEATLNEEKKVSPEVNHNPISAAPIITNLQKLRTEHKNDEVEKVATDYLKIYPHDGDVRYLLGLTYYQNKSYEKSEVELESVIKEYPHYVDVIATLIKVKYALADQYKNSAIELLQQGLLLHPNDKQLLGLQEKWLPKAVVTKPVLHEKKVSAIPVYLQIRKLRDAGRYGQAKQLALNHLEQYPKDYDVMLYLGLIYLDEENFQAAERYLQKVIDSTPDYMDARVALIRAKINISKEKRWQAKKLFHDGLFKKNNTSLKDLRDLLNECGEKNIYFYDELYLIANDLADRKIYKPAIQLYTLLLKNDPSDVGVRLKLANANLALQNDRTALNIINDGLQLSPNDTDLLLKKADIQTVLRQYALAHDTYRKVLALNPENKEVNGFIKNLTDYGPRYIHGVNEMGIFTDNAWVPDAKEVWDYTSLFYARDIEMGRIMTKINYASRLGIGGPQYEFDFSSRLNRNIYLDLAAAYSAKSAIFPNYMVTGEMYWNFPEFLELSGGVKRSQIESTYFSTYTVSMTRYQGQYMFTFRPYHFAPKDNVNLSTLYTGTFRKYFSTDDHYISATVGTGHSPDLADLLTVDFLVITNNFVTLNYEFPVCDHRFIFDVGVGYQRWGYPSGLVRNLYDGSVGLRIRF